MSFKLFLFENGNIVNQLANFNKQFKFSIHSKYIMTCIVKLFQNQKRKIWGIYPRSDPVFFILPVKVCWLVLPLQVVDS